MAIPFIHLKKIAMSKTIRDEIQDLIRTIWVCYDRVGALRDACSLDEKEYCNKARGTLYDACQPLMKFDNTMTDVRAKTPY